uniref:CCHC-type domain-containing protein n=1 Tax=Rhinopithecus roxellana TaxID=61622 RepID=A0A2K6PJP2_RHIRO
MTRWARVSTACNKRPLSITPREDVEKGSFEGTSQNLPKCKHLEANRLSLKNDKHQGKHKNNKEKKEYLNKDVNAVMEYLRQNSQMVHNGQIIATDSKEVREEIAVALKKDNSRWEGRRLKRQMAKKNAMVCFHCRKSHHGIADCLAIRALECYRCGYTEHETTKCKAKVHPGLEMGSLSRSCPDNPKGLYAGGGGCKLCGSVKHLKKDYRMDTVSCWAKGMSADYEEILDAPKLQKPKTEIPKVVNFWYQLTLSLVTTSLLLPKLGPSHKLELGFLVARTIL